MKPTLQYTTPLLILCAGIFFHSCAVGEEDESMVPITIDLTNVRDTTLTLESLLSKTDIVPLQSNDSSALITAISSVAVTDSLILVLDYTPTPAKLFDRNGRYVRQLGKIGEGPDEYLTLVSPFFNEEKNEIWVLLGGNYMHPATGDYYIYDYEGNLIDQVAAQALDSTRMNENDRLLVNGSLFLPGNTEDPYSLRKYSISSGELTEIDPVVSPDYFVYRTNISKVVQADEDSFLFYQGETDTIYQISVDELRLSPRYVLEYGEHKFDAKKVQDARNSTTNRFENILKSIEGGYSLELTGVVGDFLLFDLYIGGKNSQSKTLLVSRSSGQAYFANIVSSSLLEMPLENAVFSMEAGNLIFAVKWFDIQEHLKSRKTTINSLKIDQASTLEEDDNVLLIGSIGED
jgi:hypothetical protein